MLQFAAYYGTFNLGLKGVNGDITHIWNFEGKNLNYKLCSLFSLTNSMNLDSVTKEFTEIGNTTHVWLHHKNWKSRTHISFIVFILLIFNWQIPWTRLYYQKLQEENWVTDHNWDLNFNFKSCVPILSIGSIAVIK